MRAMFDALVLPTPTPAGFDAAAGYLTSPGIAAGWTDAEWARARQACRYLLPIVGYEPGHDPAADVRLELAELDHLGGWAKGSAIALDVEHNVAEDAPAYVAAWERLIVGAGDWPLIYCSATDRHLFPASQLWLAEWGPNPPAAPWAAWQQSGNTPTAGGPIDVSVVADSTPLYDTKGTGPVQHAYVAILTHDAWTGGGYIVVRDDGAVYAYGGAPFFGGANGKPLNAPITAAAVSASGRGYLMVAADGGVFTFGDASFHGNPSKEP